MADGRDPDHAEPGQPVLCDSSSMSPIFLPKTGVASARPAVAAAVERKLRRFIVKSFRKPATLSAGVLSPSFVSPGARCPEACRSHRVRDRSHRVRDLGSARPDILSKEKGDLFVSRWTPAKCQLLACALRPLMLSES